MEENKGTLKKRVILSNRRQAIATMKAIGCDNTEIATELGLDPRNISTALSSKSMKQEIVRIQNKIFKNPQEVLEKTLPMALKIAYKLMVDPKTKDAVKMDAAFKFMDRVLGKPKQQVEHTGNLLQQVIQEMNDPKNSKLRIVETTGKDMQKDEAADFIDGMDS